MKIKMELDGLKKGENMEEMVDRKRKELRCHL